MITLPQLITTDTDVAAGLQSGKAVDSPEDFLALLAGALGAGDAQGKDAPLSLADLQAASSKLQKGLLQKNGDAAQSVKLTDLLAQQEQQTEASLADMTDAQQLLSALTPSLKANALTTLGKVAQQDEKNTTLSDDDLANLSALFAMLPGQPLATPAVDSAPAPVDATLSVLSRGAVHGATTDNADALLPGDAKKGKADVTIAGGGANQANNPTLTPLTAAANARAEIDSTPSPTSIGMTAAPLSGPQTHAQPLPTAAPVLSAPLGSHEWQQSLSQHVTLFTRQASKAQSCVCIRRTWVRYIFLSSWTTTSHSCKWYHRTVTCAPHWKPHYRCCVRSWLKAAFNWGKATSAVKASLAISSLPGSNSRLVALKDKTFLPLKMTQYWQPQPRCKPLPAAMAQ